MSRRKVSLSTELALVLRAIDGMRLMTEKWRDGHFLPDELPRLAHALHATLVLVRERLTILDCGVRDTLDPRYLFHPENEAFENGPGDDGDVILTAWGPRKTTNKLREDADRAERHLQVLRERRQRKSDP